MNLHMRIWSRLFLDWRGIPAPCAHCVVSWEIQFKNAPIFRHMSRLRPYGRQRRVARLIAWTPFGDL